MMMEARVKSQGNLKQVVGLGRTESLFEGHTCMEGKTGKEKQLPLFSGTSMLP